jgi:hypothetical protein
MDNNIDQGRIDPSSLGGHNFGVATPSSGGGTAFSVENGGSASYPESGGSTGSGTPSNYSYQCPPLEKSSQDILLFLIIIGYFSLLALILFRKSDFKSPSWTPSLPDYTWKTKTKTVYRYPKESTKDKPVNPPPKEP